MAEIKKAKWNRWHRKTALDSRPPNSTSSSVPLAFCVCGAKMRKRCSVVTSAGLIASAWIPRCDYLCRSLAAPEKRLASGLASAMEKFGAGKIFHHSALFWWWCCVTKSVQSATLFKKRRMPSLLQIRSVSFVSYFPPDVYCATFCSM